MDEEINNDVNMESSENKLRTEESKPFGISEEEKITNSLKAEVDKKEEEKRLLNDKYLRLYAEFENFKKMSAREHSDYVKYSNEKIMKELLPVLDNIERAITHSVESRDFDKMIEGIKLTHKHFLDLLKRFGISPIENIGEQFDPAIHQAILHQETDDEENNVIAVSQKGYLLNDRVIRPALVIVSKKKDNYIN